MHLKLDTIMIFVDDFEKMSHFYQHILGFAVLEETPLVWMLLSAGNAKIGLHKTGEAFAIRSADDTGSSNTKIVFETTDNIHKVHANLLAKSVSVEAVTSFDNYPYLLFMGRDPEGNVFQVIQQKR